MNFNHLMYFRTLAKFEHYTKAAEDLEISQPTLSNAISSLERELGTSLFEKQGRNIALTRHGKIYLDYVSKALETLNAGKNELTRLNCAQKGHVSLAFISTVGSFLVPKIISRFLKVPENANISFSCNEGNTRELLKLLKEGRYDLVICSKRDGESSLDFIPLYEQKIVMLMPHGHPMTRKNRISLGDAAAYPFIMHTHDSGMRAVADILFEKAGFRPNISCEVEEDHTIAGLVEAGLGIALVSDSPNIRNANILIAPLASPVHKRYLHLVTAKNRSMPAAARVFKSYLLGNLNVIESEILGSSTVV